MANKAKMEETKLLIDLGSTKKDLVEMSKKHGLSMTAIALAGVKEKIEQLRNKTSVL